MSSFAIKFGVITVSDTAFKSPNVDKSGPLLVNLISKSHCFSASEDTIEKAIVPDEVEMIEDQLKLFADVSKCDVIITTGGTGFTPRDVTPEATVRVLERRADSVSAALLVKSLEAAGGFAMLSRGVSGIRGATLIVNLPGSAKAVGECFRVLEAVLPHAVRQLQGRVVEVKAEHAEMQAPGAGHHRHHHHEHAHYHHHAPSQPQHQAQPALTRSLVKESQVAGRPRQSPYPMITVEQAVATVLAEASRLPPELVKSPKALGRILAEDIVAGIALPPFRASVKDGYAVRACDGVGRRRVVDALTAGDEASVVLQAHCAIRVSTGGPVPSGADSVVQVEDTALIESSPDLSRELTIEVLKPVTEGQDIRPVGCDIALGAKVLCAGQRVGPCELGILASVGCHQVSCYQLPTVGIASTGNELMDPFEEGSPGGCGSPSKIRDSNRCTLLALMASQGIPVVDLGIIPDSADSLVRTFEKAIKSCQVIVTTGGVSMGEKDLVKQVLTTDFNATLHFAQVAMKPGKPTSFATLRVGERKKTLFLGLPGNPVSAFVTANLYLIPACRRMAGWPEAGRTCVSVRLGHEIRLDPRPEYHRCSLQWAGHGGDLPLAWSTGTQQSSRLLSCQAATGLLVLPPRSDWLESLPAGHVTQCMLLDTP